MQLTKELFACPLACLFVQLFVCLSVCPRTNGQIGKRSRLLTHIRFEVHWPLCPLGIDPPFSLEAPCVKGKLFLFREQPTNAIRTRHQMKTVKQQFLQIRNHIDNLNVLLSSHLLLVVRGNSVLASTEFQPGDVLLDITPLTTEPWENHYNLGHLVAPVSATSASTSPPPIKRSRSRGPTPAPPAATTPTSPLDLLAVAADTIEKTSWANAGSSETGSSLTTPPPPPPPHGPAWNSCSVADASAAAVTAAKAMATLATPRISAITSTSTSRQDQMWSFVPPPPPPPSSPLPGPSHHLDSSDAATAADSHPLPTFNTTFNTSTLAEFNLSSDPSVPLTNPLNQTLNSQPETASNNVYQDLAFFLQNQWILNGSSGGSGGNGSADEPRNRSSIESNNTANNPPDTKVEVLSLGESAGSLSVKALTNRIDRLQSLLFDLAKKINPPLPPPPSTE
jgi:hypothetical protein